jgi:hypothetical protein
VTIIRENDQSRPLDVRVAGGCLDEERPPLRHDLVDPKLTRRKGWVYNRTPMPSERCATQSVCRPVESDHGRYVGV